MTRSGFIIRNTDFTVYTPKIIHDSSLKYILGTMGRVFALILTSKHMQTLLQIEQPLIRVNRDRVCTC